MKHPIFRAAESVFVYHFCETAACEQTLRAFTSLPSAHIQSRFRANVTVSVSRDFGEFCGPMCGITASNVRTGEDSVFDIPQRGSHYQSLINADNAPILLKTYSADTPVFVASGGINVDLSAPVSGNYFDIKNCFVGTVPVIMFLRWAFQKQMWSTMEHTASLVIDDPLLKSRYGFLVFQDVLELMERHNFSTTIAFIPWNWRRTRAKTARLFLSHPDRYSLVIHGNDHTGGEFGSSSLPVLHCKISPGTFMIARILWTSTVRHRQL